MPIFTKDGRGVLFIHVPKTGGSAVENHFKSAGWKMSYHDGNTSKGSVNSFRRTTPQHMHSGMLHNQFRLNRFDVVFMIVRDPIARFRSEYVWRHGSELNPAGGEVDPSAKAVDRWAKDVFDRYEKNTFTLGNHIRPQHEFQVPQAEVFHFENGLEAAIASLNEDHGLGLPPEVPRKRTSTDSGVTSSHDVAVSWRLERKLKKFYAVDFERYGYGRRSRIGGAA